MSGEEGFFRSTQVRSTYLILFQAFCFVGKERAVRREHVETTARYPLSMGQLDIAAFFCPFYILRMYLDMLGVPSHPVGMVRQISTSSIFLRPAQLSYRWSRSCLVVTLL